LAKGFTLKGIKGDFKNLIPLNLPLFKPRASSLEKGEAGKARILRYAQNDNSMWNLLRK
jgi:hypothetical protein